MIDRFWLDPWPVIGRDARRYQWPRPRPPSGQERHLWDWLWTFSAWFHRLTAAPWAGFPCDAELSSRALAFAIEAYPSEEEFLQIEIQMSAKKFDEIEEKIDIRIPMLLGHDHLIKQPSIRILIVHLPVWQFQLKIKRWRWHGINHTWFTSKERPL